MKIILWRQPNGMFAFTVPAGTTVEEAQAHAHDLLTHPAYAPAYAGWVVEGICDEEEMPDGGRFNKTSLAAAHFKSAWDCVGGKPVLRMEKARTIHMDAIRRARKPELERLDVEWMKAMGQGRSADAMAIEANRQLLRDIPQNYDLSTYQTPEALKACWPRELPPRT